MDEMYPKEKCRQLSENEHLFLSLLVEKGGPELHEYKEFSAIVNNLEDDELDCFREIIRRSLNENTLIGHGFVKPFGYPGDFSLIHNIYRNYINPDTRYSNWDMFFQDQAGAHAVRNRKDYFLKRCREIDQTGGGEKRVLILGSGPATDVNEYFHNNPDSRIHFDLVDFDQNAIDFSKSQNEQFKESIDYFKDKHFIYMVNKYYKYLAEGGEFIIGNFSNSNPTRRLMEVLSDWYLNHRSKSDLVRMAIEAEACEEFIEVEREELGVNLFLRIKTA